MQGVIVYFRVMDGEMRVGDTVKLINTGKEHQIGELGVLAPKPVQVIDHAEWPCDDWRRAAHSSLQCRKRQQ